MENELLQGDVTQEIVETALQNYLEKLDGVAQLEIAAFYQEDLGYDTVLHVFGRTPGSAPHLYYYRRFDYHEWSPWERVELDIEGDYLVPAVVRGQLFLLWPIFKEVADPNANNSASVPASGAGAAPVQKPTKRLRMQMAISAYRQGRWTPKRMSDTFAESLGSYSDEIATQNYEFFSFDRTDIDGRYIVKYQGSSRPGGALMRGEIELGGCRGAQDLKFIPGYPGAAWPEGFQMTRPEDASTDYTGGENPVLMKWLEVEARKDHDDDLTLEVWSWTGGFQSPTVLARTPGLFRFTSGRNYSYLDKLALPTYVPDQLVGSWLPVFYADQQRSFVALTATLPPNENLPRVLPGHEIAPHRRPGCARR